jgi:transposase-like protein
MQQFKTLIQLVEFFDSESKCHQFLKSVFWSKGKFCPCCGSNKVQEYKSNFKKNRCGSCNQDFSIRKNTMFDSSRISLKKWFMCIYLINSNKKGISSCELSRLVGITQKTAWFVLQRIREATSTNFFNESLKDRVEIDESYFGGDAKNMHMHKRVKAKGIYKKAVVLGMVERGGKVKAIHVADSTALTLQREIYKNVQEKTLLMTDEYKAYASIGWTYNHKLVNHSKGEYVKNGELNYREGRIAIKIHTNTIEGFWGLVKRGVYGVYHWVSKKHLQRYLGEYSFRYNTRDLHNSDRFVEFLGGLANTKLTYAKLIAC